jgi:hypothetical protein
VAAGGGNIEVCKLLLAAGAGVNIQDDVSSFEVQVADVAEDTSRLKV